MDLNKEVDMMKRLMRVRKVERLFHLPIDPIIDYNAPKEKAQWKYIKLHFR
jgi:hypothetical protein